jgi:hypothetical protein
MQYAAIPFFVLAFILTSSTVSTNLASEAGSQHATTPAELSFQSSEPSAADTQRDESSDVTGSINVKAQPENPRRTLMDRICTTVRTAAEENELPVNFFARLIWQESRFKTDEKSRAGALGIAQFMPQTAALRGLANPWDPIASLQKSADFLRDLREQFGNLGLAAAAYNGGPGRVTAWLKGRGGLPKETRDYVQIITGVPVEQWRGPDASDIEIGAIPSRVPCPQFAALMDPAMPELPRPPATPKVQLAAVSKDSHSWRTKAERVKAKVRAKFETLRGKVRTALAGRKSGGQRVASRRAARSNS